MLQHGIRFFSYRTLRVIQKRSQILLVFDTTSRLLTAGLFSDFISRHTSPDFGVRRLTVLPSLPVPARGPCLLYSTAAM